MTRTLYHHTLHAPSRAIRVILREKKLDIELVSEPFWERRTAFFKLNPAGEVPVLVEENGKTLSSPFAIYEYLEEAYPATDLLGKDPLERAEVRRIVSWFDQKFTQEVADYTVFEKVYKRLLGYGEPSSEAMRAGKRNLLHHMDYIAHLLMSREWLAGNHMTIADIVAAAHLSCLDYLGDVPWEHHLATKEWYALIKSRPSFRGLLEDRILGFRPPAHYTNPDF